MDANNSIPQNAKVYLDKPYVQIYWDPNRSILTSRWTGFCTFEEISAVGNRILDAVLFEKAEKVLYDAREIEMLDTDSQKYISGTFTKEMVTSGVKYAATVFPEDMLAKFSVDDIKQKLTHKKGIYINYFNNLSKAFRWLEGQ